MEHFAGRVTYNQLILLGITPSEITHYEQLNLTYDDMVELLVEQLMH